MGLGIGLLLIGKVMQSRSRAPGSNSSADGNIKEGAMTTTAMASRGVTSLEDLVGRLMDALRWEKLPGAGVELGTHGPRVEALAEVGRP